MRYVEIIPERKPERGCSKPMVTEDIQVGEAKNLSDTRTPKLTLRMLNKLKHIRKRHQREVARRNEHLGAMYGNADLDLEPLAIERERLKVAQMKQEIKAGGSSYQLKGIGGGVMATDPAISI